MKKYVLVCIGLAVVGLTQSATARSVFDRAAMEIRTIILHDDDTNIIKIEAPDNVTSTYTLTLPATQGANGKVLQTTDEYGTLGWENPGTPSLEDNEVFIGNSGTASAFNTNSNGDILADYTGGLTVKSNADITVNSLTAGSLNTNTVSPSSGSEVKLNSVTTFDINGAKIKTFGLYDVTKTNESFTISNDDGVSIVYVTAGNTDRVIKLPTATNNAGRVITIKKIDAADSGAEGYVILKSDSLEETIDGVDGTTGIKFKDKFDFITVQCDGSDWYILNKRFAGEDGLKAYVYDTTYNNVPLNITGFGDTSSANSGVKGANFILRRLLDGTWVMSVNIVGELDDTDADFIITIDGVTFKNVTDYNQPLALRLNDEVGHQARALPNSGDIRIESTTTFAEFFGVTASMLELEEKPTWAHGNDD